VTPAGSPLRETSGRNARAIRISAAGRSQRTTWRSWPWSISRRLWSDDAAWRAAAASSNVWSRSPMNSMNPSVAYAVTVLLYRLLDSSIGCTRSSRSTRIWVWPLRNGKTSEVDTILQ
jgi:hypothetical protein